MVSDYQVSGKNVSLSFYSKYRGPQIFRAAVLKAVWSI